jgi:hypothetical protein
MRTKFIHAPWLFVCLIPGLAVGQAKYTVTDLGPLAPTAVKAGRPYCKHQSAVPEYRLAPARRDEI